MSLAEDASTPAVLHSPYGTSGTGTSASFSPPANSLVVVMGNLLLRTGAGGTFTCQDSLGNTYALVKGSNGASTTTGAMIWEYYYATAPGPITVTVTDSDTTDQQRWQLAPRVLTGAAASQSGAGSNTAGSSGITPNQLITTTRPGSLVYVCVADGSTGSFSPVSGTTTIDTLSDGGQSNDTGLVGVTGPTTTPGSASVGWTGPSGCMWTAVEVLPAPAKMSTLSDPFTGTTVDTTKWSTFGAGGGSVTPGTSGLSCTAPGVSGSDAGVSSLAPYDLTGSYLLVHASAVGIANSGAPAQAWLTAGTVAGGPPSTALKVVCSSGVLYMGNTTTNWASPTYDPVAHAWWRIRETSGTVYFETSPDGTSWTVQGSVATASCGVPVTALYGAVYAAMYGSGASETATYLSLNPAVAATNAPAGLATASGLVPAPAIVDEASANAAMAAAAGAALQPTLTLAAFAPARLATALARAPQPSVITAGPPPPAPVKGYCEATVTQPWAATATVSEEGSCEATVTQPMAAEASVS